MTGRAPGWLRIIAAAPHRLPFFAGMLNLATLSLWWAAQRLAVEGVPVGLARGDGLEAALHGPLTIYALFMPFILGFLTTVFPRWMNMADLPARHFLPAAVPMALASLLLAAAVWSDRLALLDVALILMLASWAAGAATLAAILRDHNRSAATPPWHGLSTFAAWLLALAGLAALLAFTALAWMPGRALAILLGTHGLVAAIFVTVCHRMIPFFAGNVVDDYVRWRPYWLLALFWPLLLADMAAASWYPGLRLVTAGGLAVLLALMLARWLPRRRMPGLLLVLVWGFAWAPLAFLLAALAAIELVPAILATHALLLGMAGSLMVAMVTRVMQGHSGRPLQMVPAAWIAFAAIQLAAVSRLAAALASEPPALLVTAALLFALGTLPWSLRGAAIALLPRRDGRSG